MKLYTEEQVMKTWNTAFIEALQIDNDDYKAKYYDDFIKELTPIELPSDEEIEASKFPLNSPEQELWNGGYEEGAKWMRNKIQGGEQ